MAVNSVRPCFYAITLINTCCWRADHEIFIHDGESRSELIFVSAPTTHVLVSDNSPLRKNYFDSNIKQNENVEAYL